LPAPASTVGGVDGLLQVQVGAAAARPVSALAFGGIDLVVNNAGLSISKPFPGSRWPPRPTARP
jgi:NAD(P)-dependent dehydrogenase (short-subunit alcohol dehydrogenase family)